MNKNIKKNIKKNIQKRWSLTISLVLFIFAVMIAAILLAGLLVMVLHLTGALPLWEGARPEQAGGGGGGALDGIFAMMALSVLLGTALAAFFGKKALNPIRKVIDATHRIAEGDYNVSVNLKGIYELEELSHSFNKMAHELSSVETLRRDFINNFSHEFKTPIVSIRGFAKLLIEGELTDEEKQEYLEIIIAESERLAELSTNVLNLSKYETIGIITEKTHYRMDEQIRRAISITEPKWSAKNITMTIGMNEVTFNGDENLTQQIWLNLLDNAIKFTEQDGNIVVRLMNLDDAICFSIQDDGVGMNDETLRHIFDKFYQGDKSHAKPGNGLGLAIVKRIVELCGGTIEVSSELGKGSIFSVRLPV